MGPQFIRAGDVLINPAHVALVEKGPRGGVTVHLALARPERVGNQTTHLPGHVAVWVEKADAEALWAALAGDAKAGD